MAASESTVDALESAGICCARLFDEVPCWISIQDRQFRVIEENRKLREDFGEHLNEHCYSMYKGRSLPCTECPVARTFADGKDHNGQQLIFDRRGLPHDVIVTTRPLRDGAGNIVAVMKVFADISGEKELENRLHDSLVRFQNLFDNAPCFITVQDRRLTVIESNRKFNESFGDPAGKHCYEAYKKHRERCSTCPVSETFADGEVHTGEEILVNNEGKEVHVLVYTAPLRNASGELTAVMKMSTDVTEIRTLQNKLATLGQLVGGIAHSIKNVLEGLRGGVYVVNLGFRDNNQQDIRTGWEMVERNVGRLSAMILDMLRCAKDRTPRLMPVDLGKVLREAIALCRTRAEEFGIGLECSISEPLEILGEAKEIHSMLTNLVGNAIDACNSDQDESKQHRVTARLVRDGVMAVIDVEDNGVGMKAELKQVLFHDLVSTKGSAGTGLGLLVAHKVAEEHGGTIAVWTEPGKGARFTVRIPVHVQKGL